jgi:hypothetical protein
MRKMLVFFWACAGLAYAQEPAKPPALGSISGVVREIDTGAPIAEVTVSVGVNVDPSPGRTTTDAEGRYVLRDMPPGRYELLVRLSGTAGSMTRIVNLGAGQELSGIDFRIPLRGTIFGRVLDENNEPVPGITVFLICRAYYLGSVRDVYWGQAQTDDRGQYVIRGVQTGRAFLLMAEKRFTTISAVSRVPADRKLRKRAYARTFYPNSPSIDGAAPVVLRSGEHREGVDIEILRTPSYCIDGVLTAQGAPASMQFSVEPVQPSSGVTGKEGGGGAAPTSGTTGTDGKIRVCDLSPGEYRLTAYPAFQPGAFPDAFGTAVVTVINEDMHNIRLPTLPRMSVPGEVAWDGTPPTTPVRFKTWVYLSSLNRGRLGAESTDLQASIPGEFSFPGLLMGDYAVGFSPDVWGAPAGFYVKDATYAGFTIRNSPLRLGTALGDASLRIVLARDGGTISAHVTDRDGNPVNAYVMMLPATATSEAALADMLLSGQTDQAGTYTSDMLAPGKYYVLATETPIDQSPECIAKLWRVRIKSKEVDLSPGGAVRVELQVTGID